MESQELARFVLLYPGAHVYVDTGGKRGTKPIRRVNLHESVKRSNNHYVVLVVEDHGSERA